MDWGYLESEIVETILWKIGNGGDINDTIVDVCKEYTKEFPQFKNYIKTLKKKFIVGIETFDFYKRKIS